jgi:signal recognition particle GTPase
MRALSKLINLNSPDLVLFVGEALVGNDAVDQLTKFNQVCTSFEDRWILVNHALSIGSPVEFGFHR